MCSGESIDVAELGVAIGVLGALVLLGGRLQAVVHLVQQVRHRDVARAIPLRQQLLRQLAGRLRGPAQSTLGIPPALRLDEIVEGLEQAGLGVDDRGRPAPGARSRSKGSIPASISATAFCSVERLMEVASATATMPPRRGHAQSIRPAPGAGARRDVASPSPASSSTPRR